MSTPLSDILPLVAAHGKSQASAFLQGEEVIAGSPDQEIWEHLARHDILWDGLTVADQDQVRDSYLEAFKSEAAQRLTVANRTETASPASSVVPAPLVPEVVKETLEALELIRGWAFMRYKTDNRDDCQAMGRIYNLMDRLRSYSPAPSPSVELLREAAEVLNPFSELWHRSEELRQEENSSCTWRIEKSDLTRAHAALSKLNAALA